MIEPPKCEFFDRRRRVFVFPLSGGSVPLRLLLPAALPPSFAGFRGRVAVQHFVTFAITGGARRFASSKYFLNVPPTSATVRRLLPRQMTLQPSAKLTLTSSIRRRSLATVQAALAKHHFSPCEDIAVTVHLQAHTAAAHGIESLRARAFAVTTGRTGAQFTGEEALCDEQLLSLHRGAAPHGARAQQYEATFPLAKIWATASRRSLQRRMFPPLFVPLPPPGAFASDAAAPSFTALFHRGFRLEVAPVIKGKYYGPLSLPFTLDVDDEFVAQLSAVSASDLPKPLDLRSKDAPAALSRQRSEPLVSCLTSSLESLSLNEPEAPFVCSFDESGALEELIRF